MSQNQGCLGFVLRLFGGQPKETGQLPYRLRDDFLSPAELAFYRVLSTVVGGKATILTKVNLADVFFVARPNEKRRVPQSHRPQARRLPDLRPDQHASPRGRGTR